jgi:hypothetical protein
MRLDRREETNLCAGWNAEIMAVKAGVEFGLRLVLE